MAATTEPVRANETALNNGIRLSCFTVPPLLRPQHTIVFGEEGSPIALCLLLQTLLLRRFCMFYLNWVPQVQCQFLAARHHVPDNGRVEVSLRPDFGR